MPRLCHHPCARLSRIYQRPERHDWRTRDELGNRRTARRHLRSGLPWLCGSGARVASGRIDFRRLAAISSSIQSARHMNGEQTLQRIRLFTWILILDLIVSGAKVNGLLSRLMYLTHLPHNSVAENVSVTGRLL